MVNCDIIEKKLVQELQAIEAKFTNGVEMTEKDLDRIDKILHSLKSLGCWKDMMQRDEEQMEEGMSGRRGRAANGRYVSRDPGSSYSEGYSRGYSEAMSRRYPPDYPANDWPMYR
jgi:hypothetical protein